NLTIADVVKRIAGETGRSPAQVALAWLRQRYPGVIPIVGARREDQIEDSLGCLDLTLSADQMERLDEVSEIELGFPHDFLAGENIRDLVYGGMWERIDRP